MEKVFKIDGMSCHHCVMAVKKEISKLDVEEMEFYEAKTDEKSIKEAIINAGYTIIE